MERRGNDAIRGVWILHLKVSNFGFYFQKFGDVWISNPEISEFGFYSLEFGGVWVLFPKVWGFLDFTPRNFTI